MDEDYLDHIHGWEFPPCSLRLATVLCLYLSKLAVSVW